MNQKKNFRHSTTIYLPRKHNGFLSRAIKARAINIFGDEEVLGKASKYIMDLIKKDFMEIGLVNSDGEPNEKRLLQMEKENEKARKKARMNLENKTES